MSGGGAGDFPSGVDDAAAGPGIVYLVGAGPGDPGLITVRGRQLLDDCDAIVHDALANPELFRDSTAELHDAGKRGGSTDSAKQDDINALLVTLARDGKRVVRLKGGDPFVFGRGSEEAQALRAAGIPFEVVPGITAGIAAPAYAGIPVTHRGVATSLTFVTGHEDPTKPATTVDWAAVARLASTGTVVLYMGVKTLPGITAAMIGAGLPADTPAAAVQWGTHPGQRTVVATVATLVAAASDAGISAPVITVIGHSVALRDEIDWFESRPLFGRRIVVTRATSLPGTLVSLLRERGAQVIEAPSTGIEPLDPGPIDAAVASMDHYSWLILTSVSGVRFFHDALERAELDARALRSVRIAVIGPATARALRDTGLRADLVPPRFVAESLLDAMRERADVAGTRVLYAGAEESRGVVPDGLRALGATVDVVATYRSRIVTDGAGVESLRAELDRGGVDLVTFTSASTVEGFLAQAGIDRAQGVRAATIGPVTTAAARSAGLDVVVEASAASIEELVAGIVRWAGKSTQR